MNDYVICTGVLYDLCSREILTQKSPRGMQLVSRITAHYVGIIPSTSKILSGFIWQICTKEFMSHPSVNKLQLAPDTTRRVVPLTSRLTDACVPRKLHFQFIFHRNIHKQRVIICPVLLLWTETIASFHQLRRYCHGGWCMYIW